MEQLHFVIAVFVAVWSSHTAYIMKSGTPHTAVLALTASGVAAFGALNTTLVSNGSEFTYSSEPLAVLFTLNALVAGLVVLTSTFSEYGDATPETPGNSGVGEQQYGDPFQQGD